MNDEELIILVREQRGSVPMTTPVGDIISRGRALRARRRIPLLTGALTAAAGAAVAVAALVPAGHQAAQSGARLAAWTVTRMANGDVDVTIRELQDPAGLAKALQDDGVPAYIAFADPAPSSCQGDAASNSHLNAIVQINQRDSNAAIVIHPSAIPSGTGLFFFDVPAKANLGSSFPVIAGRALHVSVVYASAKCPV